MSTSQDPSEVYARLLLPKRHGYPLWAPEPFDNLRDYQVNIGDVGSIIMNTGGFDPLFNICASVHDHVNAEGVPQQFRRVVLGPSDISTLDNFHAAGTDISSTCIRKTGIRTRSQSQKNTVPAPADIAGFQFTCSSSEGAILLLPDGACRIDLRKQKDVFRTHAIENALRWYQFANEEQGRDIPNGSLILVTGCDMAQSWGIASFSGAPTDGVELKFTASHVVEDMDIFTYSWQTNCSADVRTGPNRTNARPIQTFSRQSTEDAQTILGQETRDVIPQSSPGAFANPHLVDSRSSTFNGAGRDLIYNIIYQTGEQRVDAPLVLPEQPNMMHETNEIAEPNEPMIISGTREVPTVPERPRANQQPIQNQCVFIRGFRISIREGTLAAALKRPAKTLSVIDTKPQDISGTHGQSIPFTKRTNNRSWLGDSADKPNAPSGRRRPSEDHRHLPSQAPNEMVTEAFVEPFPMMSAPYHPSTVINEFLLDAFPEAHAAITHDDDWIAVIRKDEPAIPVKEDLLHRICHRFKAKVESGTVFLEQLEQLVPTVIAKSEKTHTPSGTPLKSYPQSLNSQLDDVPLTQIPSYASLIDLLKLMDFKDVSRRSGSLGSLLPGQPKPLLLKSYSDDGTRYSTSYSPHSPTMSKRSHALVELLQSERTYSSDLAVIKDLYMPLAIGSSPRVVYSASDKSDGSEPRCPMTQQDMKTIFGNITELALLSGMLLERLEVAVGSALDGGIGGDHVGALFLQMVPAMEPAYRTYITRHRTALSHLDSLPRTPALVAYLSRSTILAESLTHECDLPSLLIKPVQRLLRYSLLLSDIVAETPDYHPDKESLQQARDRMNDFTLDVSEQMRRRDVVREVLHPKPGETKERKGHSPTVSTSVDMRRIEKLRTDQEKGNNNEAEQVAKMELALKKSDRFVKKLAQEAIEWATRVKDTIKMLRDWAVHFARVIGLEVHQKSEAFYAFFSVVEHLSPLGDDAELAIKGKLQVQLACLGDSMRVPLRLLETMNNLEPLHYGLLNINFAKHRPPAEYLEASQSYLNLRGQLFSELPHYLTLLDKGIANSILQLTRLQAKYWGDVLDRWKALWDALHVDGEIYSNGQETENIWKSRWADLSEFADSLNIINPGMYTGGLVAMNQSTSVSLNTRAVLARPDITPLQRTVDSAHSGQESFRSWRKKSKDNTHPEKSDLTLTRTSITGVTASTSLPSPVIETSLSSRSSIMADRTSRPSQEVNIDYSIFASSSSGPWNANTARVLYSSRVIRPCTPPNGTVYRDLPFFTLQVGAVFDVLKELGHPSFYNDLPLSVDGEDYLLLVRERGGGIGWCLASFLNPLDRRH